MAYDESSIRVLKGLEAVRERPGMYIGDTGVRGFHHLLWEILDNSVDEALAGHASDITVELMEDSAKVSDNGRGVPFGPHPDSGKPTAEIIFTTLHAGGKFDASAYKSAGGLHGVGSSVVNALSSSLSLEIYRDGKKYTQSFSRGAPKKPKVVKGSGKGTIVQFTPDPTIFGGAEFDHETVKERLKTKAYLTPGVSFTLVAGGGTETFKFDGGLKDLLGEMSQDLELVVEEPFSFKNDDLEVALGWSTETDDFAVLSFANGIPTRDGGTHQLGLQAVVVDSVRGWMSTNGLLPAKPKIEAQDVREGAIGAIHAFVHNPQFQGQTKDRLNNPEIRGYVQSALKVALENWLNKHPKQSKALASRVVDAAKARTSARAAREKVVRKRLTTTSPLPGKLADCSSQDPHETELFIVEGDSAGGSAKQGRDRRTQAVLPLRGKVINAIRTSAKKVLDNAEVKDLVEAMGAGFGSRFNAQRLRYGKIILLMDADVDGSHITTLMLALIYTYMRPLIDEGYVYLAVPPLYRIAVRGQVFWAKDDTDLQRVLGTFSKKMRASAEISRFKGLGEMPAKMLAETTMNPATRTLLQVQVEPGLEVLTDITFNDLMGPDTEMRTPYIETYEPSKELDL